MIALIALTLYIVAVVAAGRIRKVRTGRKHHRTALLLAALIPIFATGFLSPVLWGFLFLGALGYAGYSLVHEVRARSAQMREVRA